MKLDDPVFVRYDRHTKAVVVSFADGAQASWPVRLLEMVTFTGSAWMPISPTDDELAAVDLLGDDGILWDELGQIFKIEDLKNHIYGRKAWMESMAAITFPKNLAK